MKRNNGENRLILRCLLSVTLPSIVYCIRTVADLMTSRGGPRALNLFSAFLLGQIGAHRERKKYPRAGPPLALLSSVM